MRYTNWKEVYLYSGISVSINKTRSRRVFEWEVIETNHCKNKCGLIKVQRKMAFFFVIKSEDLKGWLFSTEIIISCKSKRSKSYYNIECYLYAFLGMFWWDRASAKVVWQYIYRRKRWNSFMSRSRAFCWRLVGTNSAQLILEKISELMKKILR